MALLLDMGGRAWQYRGMNNNDTNATAAAMKAASDRRLASYGTFSMPSRPADRSRNGMRTPASRPRRNHW